jgi:hypothetical protein
MDKQSEYMDGPEFVSRTLFNHAKKFYDSYKILETHEETNLPSLVCLAFSIEIFLKSLRTRVNYKRIETFTEGMIVEEYHDKSILKGGHDLSNLFDGLSEKMKCEIRTRYSMKYYRNIKEDLSNISSGFVNWRYMYEGKTNIIHLTAAQVAGEFLFSYVNEKLEAS